MTWWYGTGWWWWWIFFVFIFFFLPLGYGWGYRGWGPWYRRRRPLPRTRTDNLPPGTEPTMTTDEAAGWGCMGLVLWIVLIIAIVWLIGVWGWGGRY
jgi:hypothetical protein